MKNKNTATITWVKHNNFGSLLQAFALQQTILKLGYNNKILNDKNVPFPGQTFKEKLKNRLAKILLPILNPKLKKQNTLFEEFRKNHILLSDKIADADKDFDQFICGSDQIWSPMIWRKIIPFYYAAFTQKKRIAYAASLGVEKYPENLKQEFCALTKDFHAISCREEVGCEIIKNTLNREAQLVLDPTLLIDAEIWRKISKAPKLYKNTKKYLLTYFLTPNDWYLNFAKSYAQKHDLKLKSFWLYNSKNANTESSVVAGPNEFLYLIDHAEMFFTDSFHGSIFATHLETQFVGFQRFYDVGKGQNFRLKNFYKLINIENFYISNAQECARIEDLEKLDFKKMKQLLAPYVQTSIDFLTSSLK